MVTVYQILHSDVCDHLSEYATLKAMGYSDATLLAVVLQQALIIAVCGYIPGAVLSVALYSITRAVTVLPLSMNEGRLVLVFFLTLFMCVASAFIAMKKLRDADPADIF